jgi:hypothetical protein
MEFKEEILARSGNAGESQMSRRDAGATKGEFARLTEVCEVAYSPVTFGEEL